MLRAVLVLMIASTVVAAPTSDDAQAKIITYENENDGKGNYRFSFKTSNGLTRTETGNLVNVGQPNEHIEVLGNYRYTDSEGVEHVVYYTSGPDGFVILPPPFGFAGVPGALTASLLG